MKIEYTCDFCREKKEAFEDGILILTDENGIKYAACYECSREVLLEEVESQE